VRIIDARDEDRRTVIFNANGVPGPGAEAAQTMSMFLGPTFTPTTGSNYTVNSGKRLRIQMIRLTVQHTAAVAATFRIRLTTALTGNVMYLGSLRLPAAGTFTYTETFPDGGLEFNGGQNLRFSLNSSGAATIDVNVVGYEYG
jgi:hypothetical protein